MLVAASGSDRLGSTRGRLRAFGEGVYPGVIGGGWGRDNSGLKRGKEVKKD
jgi:hypothetical protein